MKTTNWRSCLALLFAGTLALTGCSSSGSGKDGSAGPIGPTGPTGPTSPPGVTEGMNIEILGVTTSSGVQVHFTLKDDRGYAIDTEGVYSVNAKIVPRFSISVLNEDAQGQQLPLTVLTQSGSSSFSPTAYASSTAGTLVQNGPGDYTYTFPTADVTVGTTVYKAISIADPTKTHVVWIEAGRQTDLGFNTQNAKTFTGKDEPYYFVPAGGTAKTREIASSAGCVKCHAGFKPANMSEAFHGGTRVEAAYCDVCHNPARTSNPAADAMVFVHRIHASEELTRLTTDTSTTGIQIGGNADGTDKTCAANTATDTTKACVCTPTNPCVPFAFHGIADVTYPQSISNCAGCHAGAAQGDQWKTRPTRAACGSCHDSTDFSGVTPLAPGMVAHTAGAQANDDHCMECHGPDATGPEAAPIELAHLSIIPPDLNASYNGGTASDAARKNAAYVAAAGALPKGAAVIAYDVRKVYRDTNKHPVIEFKFKKTLNGETKDVVFNTCTTTSTPTQELMDGFVGGPSIYFAWGQPQDGIQKPADFNASTNVYLRNICNGSATTATITGPDGTGYYSVTLTATVPDTAVMLTGGLGYNYSLGSAPGAANSAQPLTQIDLPEYPYNQLPDGTTKAGMGGLIVPVTNVAKAATGYIARRAIVETAKCNNCHAGLGVSPNFHVGQRNDGPTCSFCHNPNQNNAGWSGNAKDFIHGLHAGNMRNVPYLWHAVSATDNYGDVTFPSRLNNCEACHTAGTYDFTASWYTDSNRVQHTNIEAVPNMLWSTEAAGLTAAPASYTASPYLATLQTAPWPASTVAITYPLGAGWTPSAEAAAGTVVTSPITAACVRCHDSGGDVAHIKQYGGSFYATRTATGTLPAVAEQCLICHGPGKVADIGQVHMAK